MQKQRFEGSGLLLPSISVGLLSSWGVNFQFSQFLSLDIGCNYNLDLLKAQEKAVLSAAIKAGVMVAECHSLALCFGAEISIRSQRAAP